MDLKRTPLLCENARLAALGVLLEDAGGIDSAGPLQLVTAIALKVKEDEQRQWT